MEMLFAILLVAVVYCPDSYAESFSWTNWSVGTTECLGKERIRTKAVFKKVESCESCYEEQLEVQTKTCRKEINTVRNVALKKIATSSSVFPHYPYGRPFMAIDGDTNGDYWYGSCMCTDLEHQPWLRIDLEAMYRVHEVIVYNRVDCCSSRANNITVRIETQINQTHPNLCGQKEHMNAKARFDCPGAPVGRYVHLSLPGTQYLHLCEVQVFGVPFSLPRRTTTPVPSTAATTTTPETTISATTTTPETTTAATTTTRETTTAATTTTPKHTTAATTINSTTRRTTTTEPTVATTGTTRRTTTTEPITIVATTERPLEELGQGKTGTSSSSYNPIARATDGALYNDFETRCYEDNPWMQIDLHQDANISYVHLYRREGYRVRLEDSIVSVGNGSSMERCGIAASSTLISDGDYKFYRVTCNLSGRYVKILLPQKHNCIFIRELKVFGYFTEPITTVATTESPSLQI